MSAPGKQYPRVLSLLFIKHHAMKYRECGGTDGRCTVQFMLAPGKQYPRVLSLLFIKHHAMMYRECGGTDERCTVQLC
jgi:hypothetical protein